MRKIHGKQFNDLTSYPDDKRVAVGSNLTRLAYVVSQVGRTLRLPATANEQAQPPIASFSEFFFSSLVLSGSLFAVYLR